MVQTPICPSGLVTEFSPIFKDLILALQQPLPLAPLWQEEKYTFYQFISLSIHLFLFFYLISFFFFFFAMENFKIFNSYPLLEPPPTSILGIKNSFTPWKIPLHGSHPGKKKEIIIFFVYVGTFQNLKFSPTWKFAPPPQFAPSERISLIASN